MGIGYIGNNFVLNFILLPDSCRKIEDKNILDMRFNKLNKCLMIRMCQILVAVGFIAKCQYESVSAIFIQAFRAMVQPIFERPHDRYGLLQLPESLNDPRGGFRSGRFAKLKTHDVKNLR